MKKTAFNLLLIFTLLLSSCASNTYEWVKINPDKITKAKIAKPNSELIKHVNVLVNAKYKAENIIYVENSADYFTQQSYNTDKPVKRIARKTVRDNKSLNIKQPSKAVVTPDLNSKALAKQMPDAEAKPAVNKKTKPAVEEEEAMSKLNSALIIPKKKKPAHTPVKTTVPPQVNTPQEVKTETPVGNNKQENLSYDNGLNALEDQDLEVKNNEMKEASSEPLSDNEIKEEGAKRNSYLWIGLVLLIIGLIIGLIFGGLAYFISVVGIVFLLIGYFLRG